MADMSVCVSCSVGGRPYNEDRHISFKSYDEHGKLSYAFFGVFDGHGGSDAADYAKDHLFKVFSSSKNFLSDDDNLVKGALNDAFIATHYSMWKERNLLWSKGVGGLRSNAGTTASVAFIRNDKLYIGHVGDSRIVLGMNGFIGSWTAKQLTTDHKPSTKKEQKRIVKQGGKVMPIRGCIRVIWNKPVKMSHQNHDYALRNRVTQERPVLAVSRSLGDFWSYNAENNSFIVSPQPDVSVIKLNYQKHRCLVIATDGLWDALTPEVAVHHICTVQDKNPSGSNLSSGLIVKALEFLDMRNLSSQADNITVITVSFSTS